MQKTHTQRAAMAFTRAATLSAAALALLNPGPAFPQPRLLSARPVLAAAVAGSYTIDPMHTFAGFEIQHMGISRVQGRFDAVAGHIVADPNDVSQSSVSFTAQVASIDTNVAPRDADLKSPNFFDAATYPTLTFQSTKVHKDGDHYVADGQLTIKNVTHTVSIPFRYYGPVQDPFGGTRIGIVADPITVDRQDYGITWNHRMPDGSPQLADDVTVHLSVEATLDKPAAAPAP